MSGKQDKKSRRLKKAMVKNAREVLRDQTMKNAFAIIKTYRDELSNLNFFKRFWFCWRLMWRLK